MTTMILNMLLIIKWIITPQGYGTIISASVLLNAVMFPSYFSTTSWKYKVFGHYSGFEV
jgi:hypothetical protein